MRDRALMTIRASLPRVALALGLLVQDALELYLTLHAGIRVSLCLNLIVVLVIGLDAFLDVMVEHAVALCGRVLLTAFGKLLCAVTLERALSIAVTRHRRAGAADTAVLRVLVLLLRRVGRLTNLDNRHATCRRRVQSGMISSLRIQLV